MLYFIACLDKIYSIMKNKNEQPEIEETSEPWSSTTKLVIALTFVAIIAALIVRFTNIIGPLLMAFVFAYLFYPIANFLRNKLKISWGLSVGIIYLVIFILFLGLLTLGGLAVFDPLSNLIRFIQKEIGNIPNYLDQLSQQSFTLGPFVFDFRQFDLGQLGNQLIGLIQPVISRLGNIVGAVAAGAASTIGWLLFSFLISYFVLAESKGARNDLIHINIPGMGEDIARIGKELNRIWNSFLRGQLVIILLTILIYTTYLGAMQVNFYFGLAMVAGMARFVPYIGPAVAWTTYGLVTLFQGSTIFGLTPFAYALIVIGIALLIDAIMDNLVVPRLMGDALQVHPAAVMVAAIISASLFGIIGVVLAAPVLATVKLVTQYIFYKMFDKNPWESFETRSTPLKSTPDWIWGLLKRFSPKKVRLKKWLEKKKENIQE